MKAKEIQNLLVDALVAGVTDINWNIVGPAGVGKTQIIEQVAQIAANKSGRKFGFCKSHPAQASDAGDWTGYPDKDKVKKLMRFLRPESLPTFEQGIWLIDEPNRAPLEILQALMQIWTDKKIGMHSISPGVMIVMASNPANGTYHVDDMCPALNNRICTLTFEPAAADWIAWALANSIDKDIISFIQESPDCLYKERAVGQFPSPRAWTNFSKVKAAGLLNSKAKLMEVLAGFVGADAAAMFVAHMGNAGKRYIPGKDVLYKWPAVKEDYLTQLSNTAHSALTWHEIDEEISTLGGAAVRAAAETLADVLQSMSANAESQAGLLSILKRRESKVWENLCSNPSIQAIVMKVVQAR